MIRRTLGTLTDTDVKQRRTITLGTLTGRLNSVYRVPGRGYVVVVDCGHPVIAQVDPLPAETPVEVRS